MVERLGPEGSASVEALACACGPDAWRVAMVAGADPSAAARAAVHALVIGAVRGGQAAERPAILALARSWALTSPGAGRAADPGGLVADAFWSLEEPLRAALWCTDRLGLPAADARRVAGSTATTVARGRIRREACRRLQAAAAGTSCAPVAEAMGRVVTGHAPAWKSRMVREHAAGCSACAGVLTGLGDPTAAVEAGLPPSPELVAPAHRAWRDHVGAPQHAWLDACRRAAGALGDHRRSVAAVLALATAGTFGGATSQLAATSGQTETVSALAAPVPAPAPAAPRVLPAPVFRQAVIPPLAGEVVVDPSLAHVVTPDLAQVAPVIAPLESPPAPAPVPAAPQLAAPAPFLITEPPPAVQQPAPELAFPLPVPLPLELEVEPCLALTLGPIRLALPCDR